MQKDKVVLYVVITFIVGFVIGAVSGIKFYAGERQAGRGAPIATGAPANINTGQEIAQLEEIIKKDPENLQSLITLGNSYFDTNQYAKSIEMYERALRIDPKNADVRTDMGIMYRAVKDYDRAIKEFREAARQDPNHKNSRYNLGVVLQTDKKDIPGAIAAWEDFLRVEPGGERAASVRAELQQLKELAK